MLEANKVALVAQTQADWLAIRMQELNMYTSMLTAVSVQCAVVVGFVVSVWTNQAQLTMTQPQGLGHGTFASLTITFGLYALTHATIVALWGQHLGLRGESYHALSNAIDAVREERMYVYYGGLLSVLCWHFATIFLLWWLATIPQTVLCSLILIVDMGCILHMVQRVHNKFSRKQVNARLAAHESSKNMSSTHPPLSPEAYEVKCDTWVMMKQARSGSFLRVYAAISGPSIDFFKSKKAFANHENALRSTPLDLATYRLVIELGQNDEALLGSLFEPNEKPSKAKHVFALAPLELNDLSFKDVYIFQADDQSSYKVLTDALTRCTPHPTTIQRSSRIDDIINWRGANYRS